MIKLKMPMSPRRFRLLLSPPHIPVRVRGYKKPFMHYHIGNLFSYWGNGDGDDSLLCGIADDIVDRLEAEGFTIIWSNSIHNNHCIDIIASNSGRSKWKNTFSSKDLEDEETYVELFESLPVPVRQALIGLSVKGITLSR
jgi:hypothetical protein